MKKGADATLKDMMTETVEVAKAASELHDTAGDDRFVIDDGTPKAASVTPSTGPCPSISYNESVEYNLLGSIKGHDDHFSSVANGIKSADSIEVSHMCSHFIHNINYYYTHVSQYFSHFKRL